MELQSKKPDKLMIIQLNPNARVFPIHRLKTEIPSHLFHIPLFHSLIRFIVLIAVACGIVYLFYQFDYWQLQLILSIILGMILTSITLIGHDSGHGTASRHPFLNRLLSSLSMSCFGLPAAGWKVSHDEHHNHVGVPHLDSDPLSLPQLFQSSWLSKYQWFQWLQSKEFLIWPLLISKVRRREWKNLFRIIVSSREHRSLRLFAIFDLICLMVWLAAITIAFFLLPLYDAILLILIPYLIGSLLGVGFFVTHHRGRPPLLQHMDANPIGYSYLSSRTTIFPFWLKPLEWVANGLQYQIEHHLLPMVITENLKKIALIVERVAKEEGLEYEKGYWHLALIESALSNWELDAANRSIQNRSPH